LSIDQRSDGLGSVRKPRRPTDFAIQAWCGSTFDSASFRKDRQ